MEKTKQENMLDLRAPGLALAGDFVLNADAQALPAKPPDSVDPTWGLGIGLKHKINPHGGSWVCREGPKVGHR